MLIEPQGKESGKILYAGQAIADGHKTIITIRDLVHTYSAEEIMEGKTMTVRSNGRPAEQKPIRDHLVLLLNGASQELGLAVENINNMGPRTRASIRGFIEADLHYAKVDYNHALADMPQLDPAREDFLGAGHDDNSFNPLGRIDEVLAAVRSKEPKPESLPTAFEFCAMSPKDQKRYTG